MRDRDIFEICEVREGRPCKDCIYYGKTCEAIKRRYHLHTHEEMIEYYDYSMKGRSKNGN